jgi:excisionase family DNA binding protein
MSDLLTVSEVADLLRVDDTTVRRWVKQGVLEAVVLPHVNERQAYRIKRETIDKLLGESNASQPAAQAVR